MESFRRNQEELRPAAFCLLQNPLPFPAVERGIQDIGSEACISGSLPLVFHEGDEGAHHEHHSRKQKSRELETNALPSSRREDSQGVPSVQNGPNQNLLARPKGWMTQVTT